MSYYCPSGSDVQKALRKDNNCSNGFSITSVVGQNVREMDVNPGYSVPNVCNVTITDNGLNTQTNTCNYWMKSKDPSLNGGQQLLLDPKKQFGN